MRIFSFIALGLVAAGAAAYGCASASSDGGASPAANDGGIPDSSDDASASVDGRSFDDAAEASTVDAAADADAAAPTSTQLHATSGWQIYPGGSYHYGPSILIDTDASIHMWTCSPGANGAWDYIRYRHSTDGGHTWTPDAIALQPTAGSMDAYSTCDPGAVKIGPYFYVGYTSTTNAKGTQNQLFVARSTSPSGPFDKWNGTGWGGSPAPIVTYSGDPTQYGIGEPSLVLMGKKLFVYYTNEDGTGHTDVSTVDDATVDGWPTHLTSHGHAITRAHPAEDSTDIKYDDALGRFVGVATYDRFGPNATIAVYQSSDGLTFEPGAWRGARVQIGAHNVGLSGDLGGHIDVGAPSFVAYAYQPTGNMWGDWPTFLDLVTIDAAPWGLVTAGEVSSIVGGNDWGWSGPRAWDGDPATLFSSDGHGATDVATEWASIDLGRLYAMTGLTLTPRANGYGFPVDFTLQTSSDGSTWTDVPGQSHTAFPNPGSAPIAFTFSASVVARYARVLATRLGADDNGNHYLQLGEISAQTAP